MEKEQLEKIKQSRAKNTTQRNIKRSNFKETKIVVNMTVLKNKTTNELFFSLELFDTIGEMKLFSYILQQTNFKSDFLYYHSAYRQQAIESKYGYSRASQNNYIRSLTEKKFIIKVGKGEYKINSEMVGLQP